MTDRVIIIILTIITAVVCLSVIGISFYKIIVGG